MEQKRYQVFISSTFMDLQAERLAVLNQLLSINCIPVGMELFPAADEEQFAYIKKLIDESDYYVVIIAGRYGSLADDGLSYTEKEYDYAIEKKIPVLAFLHERPGQIPSEFTDPEHAGKLTAFREKIKSSKRLIKYWTTADNLGARVQTALFHAFESRPRKGWIRYDPSRDSSHLKEQLDQVNRLIKDKQKEIDTFQRECEKLKETIESLYRDHAKLKGELEKSRENEPAFITQQAELEGSRRHVSELEMKLVEQEKSISVLKTQLDESRETVKNLRRQLAHFERKPNTLSASTKTLVKNEMFTMGRWKNKPLEWLVLDVLPDKALLITKDCLLQAPYNMDYGSVTWEKCSLRNKVLPQLLKQIFKDDKERERVLLWKNSNPDNLFHNTPGGADTDDELFILSIDEVKQYFPNNEANVAFLNGKLMWWWLRSPGNDMGSATIVDYDGSVYDIGYYVSMSGGAVRPALWLNLKS